MKPHKLKPIGHAFGSTRYVCEDCGAFIIDDGHPHHFPSWVNVSLDCDLAKQQIIKLKADSVIRKSMNEDK